MDRAASRSLAKVVPLLLQAAPGEGSRRSGTWLPLHRQTPGIRPICEQLPTDSQPCKKTVDRPRFPEFHEPTVGSLADPSYLNAGRPQRKLPILLPGGRPGPVKLCNDFTYLV